MTDDRIKQIYRHFSNEGWISPLYKQDSREKLAGYLGEYVLDNPNYSTTGQQGDVLVVDVGSGKSLLEEEILNQYNETSQNLHLKAIDLAPPEYAKNLGQEHQALDVIEGDALEQLEPIENADMFYAIDIFQEFDEQAVEELINSISDSTAQKGYIIFNSIHNILDVFEELEESSNNDIELVKQDGGSGRYIEAESLELEGFEQALSFNQDPEPIETYIQRFEEHGFETVRGFDDAEIESDTSPIPDIAEAIQADIPIPDQDDIKLSYDMRVMKKGAE
jgi:hypothetical protein